MIQRVCKDCTEMRLLVPFPVERQRPAPHPGPRCATHHRAFRKQQKARNHEQMVVKTYSLEPGGYERLYKEQGGTCAICQRATGKTKRLAVDHDHATGLVRGLLCGPCNKLVGYFRNSPEAFDRAAAYLRRAEQANQPAAKRNPADVVEEGMARAMKLAAAEYQAAKKHRLDVAECFVCDRPNPHDHCA